MKRMLKNWPVLTLILLTVIGIAIRFWRLGIPSEIVFDEVYYAKWGNDYYLGNAFFDVHPPLAKLIIGLGIQIFGYDAFGWRCMSALFGSLLVPLIYFVTVKLFKNQVAALLASLFVLCDGLLLVQSRMALLDSILVTFSLGAYAAFFQFRDSKNTKQSAIWLLVTGILMGCSLASKWTGLAPFAVILLTYALLYKELPKLNRFYEFFALILVPMIVYIASFAFDVRQESFLTYIVNWHQQTWNFHHTLTATHPYQSRWWTWLYLERPVWYHYKDEGNIVGIIALGNPILWWSSIPLLLLSITTFIRRKTPELFIPLAAFFATYVPWWFIGRTQFQYYIVGGIPFLCILIAYWISKGLKNETTRELSILFILLTITSFIFFFPILTAYPITPSYYRLHIWFKSWI